MLSLLEGYEQSGYECQLDVRNVTTRILWRSFNADQSFVAILCAPENEKFEV